MKNSKIPFFSAHRGSYSETLIDNTINFYQLNQIAFFWKTRSEQLRKRFNITQQKEHLPLDYIGLFQGKYIEFDVKETIKNYFNVRLVRTQQYQRLINIHQHQGISFIILVMTSMEKIFLIPAQKMQLWVKLSKVSLLLLTKNCYQLTILPNLTVNLNNIMTKMIARPGN